jgi:hypothetical protein
VALNTQIMEKQENVMEYKGYNLGAHNSFSMVVIKAKGQGTVPVPLRGMFTSQKNAISAIDNYLNGLKKGRKNGKTKDSSSG